MKHPEVARPGTKQDFVVTLADDQKRPLGGEVTLWLVDEAVLSLAKEGPLDPLTELIRRNQRAVAVRDTRNLVVGRVSELEEEPGGDGADEEDEAEAAASAWCARTSRPCPTTRRRWWCRRRAGWWCRCSSPTTSPTSRCARWRCRARRASASSSRTLKVRLPVLVQPQLPRFVRMGDRFWPGGVARLVEGAEGPASVDIKVTGAVEGKASSQEKVELKSNQGASRCSRR